MKEMMRHVFDLDNTLIYSDSLNNDSYNFALNKLGLVSIFDCKRITRNIAFSRNPDLNDVQKKEIIALKQMYFVNNLKLTFPNRALLKLLESHNNEICLLWTSAEELRVIAILEYYEIRNSFKNVLFSNKNEVYEDVKKISGLLECSFDHLIFYEDNPNVIHDLQMLNMNVIAIYTSDFITKL